MKEVEHYVGLVTVHQAIEQRRGLGFLVDNRHVVTAAHVVNLALGRGVLDKDRPDGARLVVSFPLASVKTVREAILIGWRLPNVEDFEGSDIAILELTEDPPVSVDSVVVGHLPVGDDVYLFGPVAQQPNGGWVRAVMMGAADGSRQQLDQEISGIFRASPGWSGGPVMSKSGQVAGMIVAKPRAEVGRVDVYAISPAVIRQCISAYVDSPISLAQAGDSASETRLRKMEDQLSALAQQLALQSDTVVHIRDSIARIERLTILPNYEVPSASDLRNMSDLDSNLLGRRVLVRLDVDIAGVERPESFFKVDRAATTVGELLDRGAKVLLLASQGLSSVDLLEAPGDGSLEWHASRLSDRLAMHPRIVATKSVDDATRLLAEDARPTAVMLPNLRELSPEDVVIMDVSATSRRVSSQTVAALCQDATLVRSLVSHYDVFVMDDFRNAGYALPSNIGLASGKTRAVGRGIERELESLERLADRCIKIGKQSSGKRIAICGSSRPEDIEVIENLLQYRLFDECLLGVFPSLMVMLASGAELPQALVRLVDHLARQGGADIDILVETAGRALSTSFKERVTLANDMVFRDGDRKQTVSMADKSAMDRLSKNAKPLGVGPATVKEYVSRVQGSKLVFHFGMLSSTAEPEVENTREVIRAYCAGADECFMAGDHILHLADQMNLVSKLSGFVTGARTASSYIMNIQLPGLVSFLK